MKKIIEDESINTTGMGDYTYPSSGSNGSGDTFNNILAPSKKRALIEKLIKKRPELSYENLFSLDEYELKKLCKKYNIMESKPYFQSLYEYILENENNDKVESKKVDSNAFQDLLDEVKNIHRINKEAYILFKTEYTEEDLLNLLDSDIDEMYAKIVQKDREYKNKIINKIKQNYQYKQGKVEDKTNTKNK